MRIITLVFLAALLLALSCVIRGPYPKPDCWIVVTNGGIYSMDVSVENLETGDIEHKEVHVGETEVWEIFELSGVSCSIFDDNDVGVKASYTDPSLTNGGLFEKGYDMYGLKAKRITITDCPGWH